MSTNIPSERQKASRFTHSIKSIKLLNNYSEYIPCFPLFLSSRRSMSRAKSSFGNSPCVVCFAVLILLQVFVVVSPQECQICGCEGCPADWRATNPESGFDIPPDQVVPGGPTFLSCATIEVAGALGLLPAESCVQIQTDPDFRELCGCPELPTASPTMEPTELPSCNLELFGICVCEIPWLNVLFALWCFPEVFPWNS